MSINFSKILSEVLSKHSRFCFLLGSADTERFREDSDVDVAIFWNDGTNEEIKKSCLQKLEDIFNRDVDLVSLNNTDDIFARQVLENGRLIFNNSDGFLLQWKVSQMSKYPDFKFSREIIENQILNRKKYV